MTGTRSLYKRLDKIEKSMDEKALVKKCVKVASQIRIDWYKRTTSGKDKNLKSFKPYSKNYKEYKSKNKNTYRGVVDLSWRGMQGGMLSGMAEKRISDGALIYMNNEDSNIIGPYHQNGTSKLPKRKFWGLSKKDNAKIKKYLFKDTVRAFR